ncbi:hypothetical protein M433DRAFT_253233 [Acidomyces richmondensis BFW]|nr:hypothetical protein M433DRAFT_253233 [Acidomyces richmondensis BFW]
MDKLIYTYSHIITSYKLGRCAVHTATALWHLGKSPHNIIFATFHRLICLNNTRGKKKAISPCVHF